MLRLIETSVCPPDKFQYRFPVDGYKVESFDKDSWLRAIKKHYLDNEYPLPDNWIALAEAQLCASLPPGWCLHENGSGPSTFINRRFSLGDAINGTNVLVEFVKQGCPIVEQEVAEERAKTCASCYALADIPGCAPCVGFSNIVAQVAGARTTKADTILGNKVCAWCRCSARANCWIPTSVSQRGVTDEMLGIAPEWCWKANEIKQLKND